MSAITITSKAARLAIMESSTVLPTPGPAMMPIRCPSPQVSSPSITRMPKKNGVATGRRRRGESGSA